MAAFPETGRIEKEKLLTQISARLGAERSLLFMRVANESLKDCFLNFGDSEVRVSIQTTGTDGDSNYVTQIAAGNKSRRFETRGIPSLLKGLVEVD